MSAITLDALVNSIMRKTQYGTPGTYTDQRAADVLKAVNDGVKKIVRAWPWDWLTTPFTLSLVGGTADYTLPAGVGKAYAIPCADGYYRKMSFKDYLEWKARSSDDGDSLFYVLIGRSGGQRKIRLVPTPQETKSLECWGLMTVPEFTISQLGTALVLDPIPADISDLLELYAIGEVHKISLPDKTVGFAEIKQADAMLAQVTQDEQSDPGDMPTTPPPPAWRRAQMRP